MSCMSQNFRLFLVSNLSVQNFRIFLLMYPGSMNGPGRGSGGSCLGRTGRGGPYWTEHLSAGAGAGAGDGAGAPVHSRHPRVARGRSIVYGCLTADIASCPSRSASTTSRHSPSLSLPLTSLLCLAACLSAQRLSYVSAAPRPFLLTDHGYMSKKIRKCRIIRKIHSFERNSAERNGWSPAVYISCFSQNFGLLHVSNLSVRNFRIFLLMYPGSPSHFCPLFWLGKADCTLRHSAATSPPFLSQYRLS